MTRRLAFALGSLLLAGGVLTGCATPAGGQGGTPRAAPSETETGAASEIDAAWLDDGRIIGLVTSGSSTCVPFASDAAVDDGVLSVTLEDPDGPCTRDLVPRVTLVSVPEGVDPAQGIEIAVSGSVVGQTELAGAEGLTGGGMTEYLPSAAWTATEGQLVIVTWGSSGCVPVIQDATATGPTEVTVTFETPPADQVCTADMGPRGVLAEVTGVESREGGELVLTGDQYDNVRVPILG